LTHPLVAQARTYIGTKYRHRGRDPKIGLDCAGLPWRCYADLGAVLPDLHRYGREPHRNGLMQAVVEALGTPVWQGSRGVCVPRDVLQPGDVAVMRFVAEPHHLAIIGDDLVHGLTVIHADGSPSVGRVVEVGLDGVWQARIVAVFRRSV
jgi:cell wall-associated NlpC family hydrolase